MWSTFSKRSADWRNALSGASDETTGFAVRCVTCASSSEAVVPSRGRRAAFAVWVEGLLSQADLNSLRIQVGSREARLTYIGSAQIDGLQQVTAILPPGLSAGFQPFRLACTGTPLAFGASFV